MKMHSEKIKRHLGPLVLVVAVTVVVLFGVFSIRSNKQKIHSVPVSQVTVDTQILARGSVRSLNEAELHFQTGGKLTYLPLQEGDPVYVDQTIASIDSYTIQKQLQAALNNYRSTRDSFDQTNDNVKNNILQSQQKTIINSYNAGITNQDEVNVVNDIAKRIVDENQANLDNSVIQVELANYAFTLSSITSPINGVLIHEDVKNSLTNITPQTTFRIIDPNALVFRANVSEDEIGYITQGTQAQINLSGQTGSPIDGTVVKIYPEKITLATGENVYQVDIASSDLAAIGKYGQDGAVLIKDKFEHPVITVPSWLVLNKEYIWLKENGKPMLKKISVGDTLDGKTIILKGVPNQDEIILNPQSIASANYFHL